MNTGEGGPAAAESPFQPGERSKTASMETVIAALQKRIPQSAGWRGAGPEPYGAYYVNPSSPVRRILYCVTPTQAVVDRFHRLGYELLISHHPFVQGPKVPQVVLHTALDCCEGGLNDQWRDALGLQESVHFDENLGWFGRIAPVSLEQLVERCEAFVGTRLLGQVYARGGEAEREIRSVVICTGLGGLVTELARRTGADCYLLGEATAPADTMGFPAVIEVGHTLSEQVGVNLLRRILPDLSIDVAPLSEDVFGREVFRLRGP